MLLWIIPLCVNSIICNKIKPFNIHFKPHSYVNKLKFEMTRSVDVMHPVKNCMQYFMVTQPSTFYLLIVMNTHSSFNRGAILLLSFFFNVEYLGELFACHRKQKSAIAACNNNLIKKNGLKIDYQLHTYLIYIYIYIAYIYIFYRFLFFHSLTLL